MPKTPAIGYQNFEDIITKQIFYIDKTHFIEEWWENKDQVTLIARPRRFGKTLNMSMLEQFFSVDYAGRGELFEGLYIWEKEDYRSLQGSYPVISLTFANVKEITYENAKIRIGQIISSLYEKNSFFLDSGILSDAEQEFYRSVRADMPEVVATAAIHKLSEFLFRYYGKKVIILLDEYDTPMQEAYVSGFWNEMVQFIRNMFNGAFKTNSYLERAVLTGITRVGRESVFSDLNNLETVTTTANKYACSFGFTEEEVFRSLDEFGLSDKRQEVKAWYDGFAFGAMKDIYNPWSVLNYLSQKKADTYWANTRACLKIHSRHLHPPLSAIFAPNSGYIARYAPFIWHKSPTKWRIHLSESNFKTRSSSNSLAGKLIQEGSRSIKQDFENLLAGGTLVTTIDEQIVYNQLDSDEHAVWSLLLASGYLKVVSYESFKADYSAGIICGPEYELALTNLEVKLMFRTMVRGWFGRSASDYNDFIRALLAGNLKEMNACMNRISLECFSSFDTGRFPQPERFYHGFVLGLMASLQDRYLITSNRESGFGRYDVMLEPRTGEYDGILMEFKICDPQEEAGLPETVKAALAQIEEKQYDTVLIQKNIPRDHIRKYGIAFAGKKVLIGEQDSV